MFVLRHIIETGSKGYDIVTHCSLWPAEGDQRVVKHLMEPCPNMVAYYLSSDILKPQEEMKILVQKTLKF